MRKWKTEFLLFRRGVDPVDFLEAEPGLRAREVLRDWFRRKPAEVFMYIHHLPSGSTRKTKIHQAGPLLFRVHLDGAWRTVEEGCKRLKLALRADHEEPHKLRAHLAT